jgi:hypothetical protein
LVEPKLALRRPAGYIEGRREEEKGQDGRRGRKERDTHVKLTSPVLDARIRVRGDADRDIDKVLIRLRPGKRKGGKREKGEMSRGEVSLLSSPQMEERGERTYCFPHDSIIPPRFLLGSFERGILITPVPVVLDISIDRSCFRLRPLPPLHVLSLPEGATLFEPRPLLAAR